MSQAASSGCKKPLSSSALEWCPQCQAQYAASRETCRTWHSQGGPVCWSITLMASHAVSRPTTTIRLAISWQGFNHSVSGIFVHPRVLVVTCRGACIWRCSTAHSPVPSPLPVSQANMQNSTWCPGPAENPKQNIKAPKALALEPRWCLRRQTSAERPGTVVHTVQRAAGARQMVHYMRSKRPVTRLRVESGEGLRKLAKCQTLAFHTANKPLTVGRFPAVGYASPCRTTRPCAA